MTYGTRLPEGILLQHWRSIESHDECRVINEINVLPSSMRRKNLESRTNLTQECWHTRTLTWTAGSIIRESMMRVRTMHVMPAPTRSRIPRFQRPVLHYKWSLFSLQNSPSITGASSHSLSSSLSALTGITCSTTDLIWNFYRSEILVKACLLRFWMPLLDCWCNKCTKFHGHLCHCNMTSRDAISWSIRLKQFELGRFACNRVLDFRSFIQIN